MNGHRLLYLIPLIIGRPVLFLGGFVIALEASSDGTALSLVIMVATAGLALLPTAVVMAITELTSATKRGRQSLSHPGTQKAAPDLSEAASDLGGDEGIQTPAPFDATPGRTCRADSSDAVRCRVSAVR
ncbi:hypothetical protein ABZV14_26425 [Streptosporangium canum]|uniref:hypothetical protein n=1 Tax=Streptosporangium canum TaxID=324952 RepID=UPI0033B7A507